MTKKYRFSGRLSAVRKPILGSLLTVLLLAALAILLTTCAGGAGDGAGVFTLVTGSGTVTVNLVGASDFEEYTFYFGTISTGTPLGGGAYIDDSDNMLLTIDNGDDDIVFTGGLELEVGGFIDVNSNGATSHMGDNDDYGASKTVTVSGNTTVTLNYPGDFTLVTGSGVVSVELEDADIYNGETFYFGTTSIGDPIGGDAVIAEGGVSEVLDDGETDITFTGGLVLEVGGFIDVNDNGAISHMPDDGDWVGGETVTVNEATEIVTLNYPDDFTEVSGSGTVSVNLKDAFSSHAGKSFYFGTTSSGSPLGDSVTIDSDGMLLTIADEGTDVEFTGGTEITVGGFIDVNGNGDQFHMPDDGDYQASSTATVSGDTVVTLTYE